MRVGVRATGSIWVPQRGGPSSHPDPQVSPLQMKPSASAQPLSLSAGAKFANLVPSPRTRAFLRDLGPFLSPGEGERRAETILKARAAARDPVGRERQRSVRCFFFLFFSPFSFFPRCFYRQRLLSETCRVKSSQVCTSLRIKYKMTPGNRGLSERE